MKKHAQYLLPLVLVVVFVLIFAGSRMWNGRDGAHPSKWPELSGGVYTTAVTDAGVKYLVPPSEVYVTGLTSEDRPVLKNPKMVDITTADTKLADELEGIAVTVGQAEYFYPFQILNWHEIVEDELNGTPLIITYAPLTGSTAVYSGVADAATGERFSFEDSGKTYNNTLLMVDTHGTLWDQTTGQAVVGETVGQRLEMYPSTVMTWAAWKEAYPNGLALSTDTGFARDYGRHPYANYETSKTIYFPLNFTYSRLDPKTLVYRIDHGDATATFVKDNVAKQVEPNVTLGEGEGALNVAAFADEEGNTVRFYNRTVNGQTLTFTYDKKKNVMTDKETGSKWSVTGVATSGALRGTALTEVPSTRHYAFAHFAMFPNTLVSGEDLLPAETAAPEGETLQVN